MAVREQGSALSVGEVNCQQEESYGKQVAFLRATMMPGLREPEFVPITQEYLDRGFDAVLVIVGGYFLTQMKDSRISGPGRPLSDYLSQREYRAWENGPPVSTAWTQSTMAMMRRFDKGLEVFERPYGLAEGIARARAIPVLEKPLCLIATAHFGPGSSSVDHVFSLNRTGEGFQIARRKYPARKGAIVPTVLQG